ncbi:MAG: BTAD domain-containing putative transcriptional regulator [Nocardioides sp.]|uniref:BTAD domain-containing putative transcriptional regulator n=1 Tax=Nocardioides sp. TaxID=35761 RepID=UPI0039E28613
MRVSVLGPTLVAGSAGPIALPAAKHRALIGALALRSGRPVPADTLVAALWGDDAPASALGSLQSYVSVVRRALEPELPARHPSSYLASSDLGYQLTVPDDAVDAAVFTRVVNQAHAALGALTTAAVPAATDPAAIAEIVTTLDEALALWRAEPYADVVGDLAAPERARLHDLRLLALEDRATALVATGRDAEAIGELEALTTEHPLRERLWVLLATALARSGRQADALAAIARLRATLDEELGIDPSADVHDLQTAILRQEVSPVATVTVERPPGGGLRLPVPDWPMVGREAEAATLDDALTRAMQGEQVFVALVGEPGVGKSRLSLELGREATAQGARVLVGRCAQGEDAPPLWPWSEALGRQLVTSSSTDHDAERFRVAEEVRHELGGDTPTVLFLEDLHWADASSLRVLRHVVSRADHGGLLVVATWRPAEEDGLSDVVEALARRHANRIELVGLTEAATISLVEAITGTELAPDTANAARARTEGNPFFLIEYARLARDNQVPLADVLGETPRSIADVVNRRISQLPKPTVEAITAGAAIGREFELDLLALALDADEARTLDLIEPALDSELIQDLGADRFRFSHALVRDTAYADLAPSRRERMHARLAELVAEAPGRSMRASEIARHWAAAGERRMREAWHAAANAGEVAMAAHAPEQAVRHYASALEMVDRDQTASEHERYDLLVGYADACRWSTRLLEAVDAVDEAIAIAGRLADPELVVRAARVLARGSIWPWRLYGMVSEPVVRVMRDALAQLPSDDSAVRCRLMAGLGRELVYTGDWREIEALVEEAIAAARRLGDPELLVEVLLAGYCTVWRRAANARQIVWSQEAIELAREHGFEREQVTATFLHRVARCTAGDLTGAYEELMGIADEAQRHRLYFVEMATRSLHSSLAVLKDDRAAIAADAARLMELDDLISVANKADAIQGALLYPLLFDDSPPPHTEAIGLLDVANVPVAAAVVMMFLRKGRPEEARAFWETIPQTPEADNWYAEAHQTTLAEIALGLGLRDLGAQVYEMLLPGRGGLVVAGSGPAYGPVEASLALAAAAAGEREIARAHADVALTLLEEWELPAAARLFVDLLDRHGITTAAPG